MRPPRHKQPYHYCPRYMNCSVNACPLDSEFWDHPSSPDDPERVCHTRKSTRLALVAELRAEGNPFVDQLPFAGLTAAEDAGRRKAEAFAALPEEERARRTAGLIPFPTKHSKKPNPAGSDTEFSGDQSKAEIGRAH
ncbi:MAG: hypothetical protein KKI08_03770, partial [Armatimonadetes bacterium]|nr:hypothetical protein [Armatimonadota bacterium]